MRQHRTFSLLEVVLNTNKSEEHIEHSDIGNNFNEFFLTDVWFRMICLFYFIRKTW